MEEEIELLRLKINELEKKLELYYQLLQIKDELDFIMKGKYILPSDINAILDGTYEVTNE